MQQPITIGLRSLFLAVLLFCAGAARCQHGLEFSGYLEDHRPSDTVYLSVWHDMTYPVLTYQQPHREFACPTTDGHFAFAVDSIQPGDYVELGHGQFQGTPLSPSFLNSFRAQPGDSIVVTATKRRDLHVDPSFPNKYRRFPTDGGWDACPTCSVYSFSGRGAAKYECVYRLDTMRMHLEELRAVASDDSFERIPHKTSQQWLEYHWNDAQYVNPRVEKLLFTYRHSIPPAIFRLVETDALSWDLEGFWYMANNLMGMDKLSPECLAWLRRRFEAQLGRLPSSLPLSSLTVSHNGLSLLLTRARVESRFAGGAPVYPLLKKEYKGRLRDRLITAYLVEHYSELPGADTLLQDALSLVTDAASSQALRQVADAQLVGHRAYDFSLPDSSGRLRSLHELAGKVVFMDFWYTGCTGCSAFYQNVLSKVEEHYRGDTNVVFISVSIDGNKEKWMHSVASGKYSGELAMNLYTAGKGYTAPVIKAYNVLAYPRPLVIGRDGRLFNNSEEYLRSSVEHLEGVLDRVLSQGSLGGGAGGGFEGRLQFSGHLEDTGKEDTVYLSVWKDILTDLMYDQEPHRVVACPLKDGYFHFSVDSVRKGDYVRLGHGRWHGAPMPMTILNYFHAEPGDSVFMDARRRADLHVTRFFPYKYMKWATDAGHQLCDNCSVYTFSGRGAAKYECTYRMDTTELHVRERWAETAEDSFLRIGRPTPRQFMDYKLANSAFVYPPKEKVLQDYRGRIDPAVFDRMRTDVLSFDMDVPWYSIDGQVDIQGLQAGDRQYIQKIFTSQLERFRQSLSPQELAYSTNGLSVLLLCAGLESRLFDDGTVYSLLKKEYSGVLRDRLITSYLMQRYSRLPDAAAVLQDAIATVGSDSCFRILRGIADKQLVGQPTFDFSLPDVSGDTVRLHDLKGKVVFIDFWYTGCGGCAQYYQRTLSKVEEKYKGNPDVVFLSVSIDGEKEQWKKSIGSGLYTSALAKNLYTAGQGSTHPLIKAYNVIGYPRPLVIGRDGRLFNNSTMDLKENGERGLERVLDQALAEK